MSVWKGGVWASQNGINAVGPWKGSLWRSERSLTSLGIKKLLFGSGQQGVMYVPQPIVDGKQVLFQDSAGTTPVTADGQPVGLMLDLHKGLERGPELVTNGAFDTDLSGWTDTSTGTGAVTFESNAARFAGVDSSNRASLSQGLTTTDGTYYTADLDILDATTGRVVLALDDDATGPLETDISFTVSSVGEASKLSIIFKARTATTYVNVFSASDGSDALIDNISVRELPGNHATQSTAAAKPLYRTDGTLHWLEFDGVDDYLRVAFGSVIAQPITTFISVAEKSADVSTAKGILDGVTTTYNATRFTLADAGNGPEIYALDNNIVAAGYSPPLVNTVITSISNGANSIVRRDGIQVFSGDGGVDGSDGATIGSNAQLTRLSNSLFYGIIIVSAAPETDSPENYLANLQGRTL